MITPQDALSTILRKILPEPEISLPLKDTPGYTLAENIFADRDQPAADRSAMDGFAVRAEDLSHLPCQLRLIGEIQAGAPAVYRVQPGTCVRILTGANIPDGANAVVKVEETEENNDIVTFNNNIEQGANIRRQGEEAVEGSRLLPKGTILGPVEIGLCASIGKARLTVISRPQISVLCTGAELKTAGDTVKSHEIRDSNGPMLGAVISLAGFAMTEHKILSDNVETIAEELLLSASLSNVILVTGGVSVGLYDFVQEAVESIGAAIHFHGVSMKPGKPLLYATLPENRHIFGLPGNPLSVLTGFYTFVLPALYRLSGRDETLCCNNVTLPLSHAVKSKNGRSNYKLARVTWNSDGPAVATLKSKGSGDLASGRNADGVIILPPESGEIAEGTKVEFQSWRLMPW